mmetsp:Transcript_34489/g.71825  ORF Transcript_34489/g.71825 Transcript_34489/m.71825 type:complete len:184 (-) Transcript_34489:101-652(-)
MPALFFIASSGARLMTRYGKLEAQYFGKNGGNLGGNGKSMFFGGGRTWRYSQSKLANSVMMYTLQEKSLQANEATKNIRVCAAHPGGSATSLGNHVEVAWYEAWFIFPILTRMFQSAADGTMGLLTGMMATDALSGTLYGPLANGSISGPAVPNPPKPFENDPANGKLLWDASAETTGVEFIV